MEVRPEGLEDSQVSSHLFLVCCCTIGKTRGPELIISHDFCKNNMNKVIIFTVTIKSLPIYCLLFISKSPIQKVMCVLFLAHLGELIVHVYP